MPPTSGGHARGRAPATAEGCFALGVITQRQSRSRAPDGHERNSALDAAAFAAIVREASDEALDELLTGRERAELLDGIFARMPAWIRRGAAGALDAVVHWHVG